MSLMDNWGGGGGGGGGKRGYDDDDRAPSKKPASKQDHKSGAAGAAAGAGAGKGGAKASGSAPPAAASSHAAGAGEDAPDEPPMFRTVKLEFRPTREQGSIIHMGVGNEVLLIGMENCTVVRWNVGTNAYEEIALFAKPAADARIHKVFIDPNGTHSFVALTNGTVFYLHAKSNKPLQLKTKGVVVESVAWDPAPASMGPLPAGATVTDERAAANAAAAARAHVLIGTSRGHIMEVLIEAEKEKVFKRVYDLSADHDFKAAGGDGVPISGLRIELFPATKDTDANKFFVMAATPTRHYQFIGGPTFEALFAKYASNPAFVELPGDLGYSELRFYSKNQSRVGSASETCAWMNGAGIYYGNLVFGSQDQPGDRVVDDGKLLAYPNYPPAGPAADAKDPTALPPLSLILTEFHFLLLNKKRLYAINQLSEEIVYEEAFPEEYGNMKGLCPDPRHDTAFMFSNKFVYEIEIDSEDRDVWRLYLNDGKYQKALEYCDTAEQKEQVLNAQADHYFSQRLYEMAAQTYAKTQRSFEEVTLRFVNTGAQHADARNALKTYLMAKLESLAPQEITQQAMICTWLTEIFLDNINALSINAQPRIRSLGAAGANAGAALFGDAIPPTPKGGAGTGAGKSDGKGEKDAAKADDDRSKEQLAVIQEFHDFLDNYSDCLNRQTTFELISSHGRTEELLRYAKIIGDMEWVIGHHIQQRNYKKALSILKHNESPQKIEELFYKFAPVLMHHLSKDTVDMLIEKPFLDATKLIPALMRYETARMAALAAEAKRDPKEVARERKAAEERDRREQELRRAQLERERQKEAAAAAAAAEREKADKEKEAAAAAAAGGKGKTDTVGGAGGKGKTDDKAKPGHKSAASLANAAAAGAGAGTGDTPKANGKERDEKAAPSAADLTPNLKERDLFGAVIAAASAYDSVRDPNPNHAIRFLEHCVKQKNKEPAIHNYLVSLYAKESNELPLLRFVVVQRHNPLYDYKYALRLCQQHNKKTACVYVYATMRLFDDAVKLAVDLDIDLAKKLVEQSEAAGLDMAERKRLWLVIARKVIDSPPATAGGAPGGPSASGAGGAGAAGAAGTAGTASTAGAIKRAMAILKECELQIEDVLPFFPNFTKIGEFKNEICASLEQYNRQIEELKLEMDEYTQSANLLRKDINDLRNRSGFVTASQKCDLCSQPVLTRQFYLFPCTHVFHVDCVVNEHRAYLDRHPRIRSAVLSGAHVDLSGADLFKLKLDAKDAKDAKDKDKDSKQKPGHKTNKSTDSTASAAGAGLVGASAGAAGGAAAAQRPMSDKELKMVEQWASSECLFCGDLMIESVAESFVSLPAEGDEAKSWEI